MIGVGSSAWRRYTRTQWNWALRCAGRTSFKASRSAATLSASEAEAPAYRAERTPGWPLRASTARPLSSARAGSPVSRAAWRALRMAFSTKVTAGSSASLTPSSPWATGCNPRGLSSSVSSAILPLLLLAMTNFWLMASVIEQGMGETNRQIPVVASGPGRDVERHQVAGTVLVLGNEVDRVTLLNTAKGEKIHLLDVVGHLPLYLPANRPDLAMFAFGHNGNVDDANAPAALQVVGPGHFWVKESAWENAPVHLIVTEVFLASLRLREHQQAEGQGQYASYGTSHHHGFSRVIR